MMKQQKNVEIPVSDVLKMLAAVNKAKASTRSRGIRRGMSSMAKRLEKQLATQAGGKVSMTRYGYREFLRDSARLVAWGTSIGNLIRAIIVN